MTELRIAAEFGQHPLWRVERDGSVENLSPADVVSPALAARLDAWAAAYDATYNEDYPPDSAFATAADEEHFIRTGEELARAVADEVGDRFDAVTRFDTDARRWVPVRTVAP